jgi:threonine dehydratase
MKLMVEPSGTLGLAALLSRRVMPKNRLGMVLSGGNIDGSTMVRILSSKGE